MNSTLKSLVFWLALVVVAVAVWNFSAHLGPHETTIQFSEFMANVDAGKVDKVTVKEFPFPVDETVVNRGQERYNIYCSPCHDKTGSGNGMVIQRGFKRQPPSYHIDRLRQADVGYFFDVITNGFGAMPDYKAQIAPRDRWAIVAYIRALQLSQHAAASDVPGGDPTKVPQPAGGERAPEKH